MNPENNNRRIHSDRYERRPGKSGPPKSETRVKPVSEIENKDWIYWRDKSLSIEKSGKARAERLLSELEAKAVQCHAAERMLGELLEMPAWKLAFKARKIISQFLKERFQ